MEGLERAGSVAMEAVERLIGRESRDMTEVARTAREADRERGRQLGVDVESDSEGQQSDCQAQH